MLHLYQAEEENTRLGLKVQKIHTEEYLETMVTFSYVCAFGNVV